MSFQDTFTKKQKDDNHLAYDNNAFMYYSTTILALLCPYLTYRLIRRLTTGSSPKYNAAYKGKSSKVVIHQSVPMKNARLRQRNIEVKDSMRITPKLCFEIISIICLWVILVWSVIQLRNFTEIVNFDPFTILNVTHNSTKKEVKRAYHKLSLLWHPDKNANDAKAAAMFIKITKAYSTLTNPIARENYEKFGNPDGPQSMSVGIGLPSWILDSEYQTAFLLAFFLMLLVAAPASVIQFYQKHSQNHPNGLRLGESIYVISLLSKFSYLLPLKN